MAHVQTTSAKGKVIAANSKLKMRVLQNKPPLFAAVVKQSEAMKLSLHPAHLTTDKEDNLLPASLIPICSYQLNSSMLGREVGSLLNFTVCDSFKQTVHQGQLCYSLQLNRNDHGKSRIRKKHGLLLILDPQIESEGSEISGDFATISLKVNSLTSRKATMR